MRPGILALAIAVGLGACASSGSLVQRVPASTTTTRRSGRIILCTSQGPLPGGPQVVPSVIGLSFDDAARRLACDDGFRRIVAVPTNAPTAAIVTAQTPVAGAAAGADTTVVLGVDTNVFLHRTP